jgi:hypothetical protein
MAYMVSLLALLILLEKFLARGSPVYLTGSVLAALAVLSSHAAARVFLPLFLTAYLFTRRTEARRAVRGLAPQAVLAGFVLATYLAVQLYFVFVYDSPASAIQASLLSYFAFRDGIDLQAILGVILRYLQHWSPQFLIFQGDPNVKYSTGVVGQLGLLGLFSYLGLYWVVQNRRHPAARTFVWWAILWPLPSALIVPDNPNAVRGISGLPLLLILATGGLYVAARSLRGHLQTRSSWIVPALTIILCQGAFSIWAYFFAWAGNPRLPDAFDYGYRQAADVLLQLPPKPVIVSDRWRAQDLLAFHGLDAVSVESIPSQEAPGDDQFARRTKYLLTSDPSELANLRRVGHGVTVIQEIRTPHGDTRMWLARVHPHA